MREMLLSVDDDFDLKRIADSGQCFRWEYVEDDTFRIVHRDKCLYITKCCDGRFLLDCGEEEFKTVKSGISVISMRQ